MQKIIILFGLLFLHSLYCCEQVEIKYPEITSLDESNIDFLLERGETNLIRGDFLEAQEYFSKAIELCTLQGNQEIRLCRAFFNRSISNAALDLEENAITDIRSLETILNGFQCLAANNESDSSGDYIVHGKPILGPDEISMEDCLDRVEGTEKAALAILSYVPCGFKVKTVMTSAIIATAQKARRCCRAGGIWKACITPLLTKWYDLKAWERECKNYGKFVEPPCWD